MNVWIWENIFEFGLVYLFNGKYKERRLVMGRKRE